LLIPPVTRTWAPKGKTPYFYHHYRKDKISAISSLAVSPKRRRLALFIQFRTRDLNGLDVRAFFKDLLKHLRGPLVLLWDRSPIHRRKEVKEFLARHPRLRVEYFPAYAPELNPAEYVWNRTDHTLCNSAPEDLAELKGMLRNSLRKLRRSQSLLWSCIYASDLPWTRN
jgi:transposase